MVSMMSSFSRSNHNDEAATLGSDLQPPATLSSAAKLRLLNTNSWTSKPKKGNN